ncbi:MAG TPA: thioredoxin domain-containing protein [Acidobacteriaceae bacterium]|nr:thioredoxin domain-containing protein [Acidobacteriaceae bacterium]
MHSRRILKQALLPLMLAAAAIAAPIQSAAQQGAASAPSATPVKFPPISPANFTAGEPSRDTVEAFLKASWGYDPDRVWQVWAILKTPAPGVSRVIVQVAQKNDPQHRIASAAFLVTPDGKHLISANLNMLPFGAHPYAEAREMLMQRANGPSRGAADKKFELVEFADFECPHCKEAQPVIQRLLTDFPQAHFVFENFPLVSIHTEAFKAAAYSVCVAQQAGDAAFFKFADAVFTNQQQLTPDTSDAALGDAATKVGLNADKVGACSYTQAAKDAVNASMQLGKDLNVDETPTLFINGRQIPVGEVASGQLPYEALKQIVAYQFQQDQ